MDEPINFRKARAEKEDDSTLWTPQDALEDVIFRIKSGKIDPKWLAIHYTCDNDNGGSDVHYCCAGLTYPNHIALLEIAKQRLINDWKA